METWRQFCWAPGELVCLVPGRIILRNPSLGAMWPQVYLFVQLFGLCPDIGLSDYIFWGIGLGFCHKLWSSSLFSLVRVFFGSFGWRLGSPGFFLLESFFYVLPDFFEWAFYAFLWVIEPIFQVQHTVLLFPSWQFFLCSAGVRTRCIYISRLLCLFSKHFLSFFAWQNMFSALKNYTMTTWQGLIFWNNSCPSLSNVCASQHLEASSNTTCANSSGQRSWSKLSPNNGFTGATVSLEVIWRSVLGEKTSPSAEYYARHVLGQWGPCSVFLITTSQPDSSLASCRLRNH